MRREFKAQNNGQATMRFPTWLTVDVTVIAISMIIIAVGVWIGFEGPSFP